MTMGDWAERAAKRFHEQSSDKRKEEELTIQRAAKTQAAAEMYWKELVDCIRGDVKNFNALMGREFLEFQNSENEVEIHAPKLWLKFWIEFEVPDIKFAFQKPFPSLKSTESGNFSIVLQGEEVCITGAGGLAQSVEAVGASLLDPLII
jgi:hypothetical protein